MNRDPDASPSTCGPKVYGNATILDCILDVCSRDGRTKDILAVLRSSSHGADVARRVLYGRVSELDAEYNVASKTVSSLNIQNAIWVKVIDVLAHIPAERVSASHVRTFTPVYLRNLRARFPNLSQLYFKPPISARHPTFVEADFRFDPVAKGGKVRLVCRSRVRLSSDMGTDAISAAYHDFGAWGVSDVTSNVVDLEVDLERGTSDAFRVSFASDSLPPHATLGHLQVNACVYHGVDAMEPFRILAAKIGADLRDLTIIGSHSTDNLSEVLSLYPALTTFRYTPNSPQAALGNLPSLIHTFRTRAPQLRDLHLGISLPGCSRGVLDDPYLIDADWSPGPIQHLTLDLKISRDLDTNLFPAIFRIARALAGLLAKDGTITAYQTWERRDACTARMNYLLTGVTLWLQTLNQASRKQVKHISTKAKCAPVILVSADIYKLQRQYGGIVTLRTPPDESGPLEVEVGRPSQNMSLPPSVHVSGLPIAAGRGWWKMRKDGSLIEPEREADEAVRRAIQQYEGRRTWWRMGRDGQRVEDTIQSAGNLPTVQDMPADPTADDT